MKNSSTFLLKFSLAFFSFIAFGYGLIYIYDPSLEFNAAGVDPIPLGWMRWIGAIMISIGIGAILIIKNPQKQGNFVVTMALGTLMSSLTLLYSYFFDKEGLGEPWHTISPMSILFILSILLWIGIWQAKKILW